MNHHSTSDPHRYSSPVTYYPPPSSPATIITYYLLPITYSNSSFSGNQHELSLTVFLTRCSGGTDGSWDSSQGR